MFLQVSRLEGKQRLKDNIYYSKEAKSKQFCAYKYKLTS